MPCTEAEACSRPGPGGVGTQSGSPGGVQAEEPERSWILGGQPALLSGGQAGPVCACVCTCVSHLRAPGRTVGAAGQSRAGWQREGPSLCWPLGVSAAGTRGSPPEPRSPPDSLKRCGHSPGARLSWGWDEGWPQPQWGTGPEGLLSGTGRLHLEKELSPSWCRQGRGEGDARTTAWVALPVY